MRHLPKFLAIVYVFACVGCHKTTDNTILHQHYFPASSYNDVKGEKLGSIEQVADYVARFGVNFNYRIPDIFTNRPIAQTYYYVTTDAELVMIKKLRHHSVHAGLLNTNVSPGIRVYLIDGNPNTPIKLTDTWTQNTNSVSDGLH
jgi:hypothetical protein